MKEGLYIDVVSKTIISRLSELIAQLVGDNLSEEIKKVLLTKLPGVISDEISPAISKARKDAQETAKKSEKKVLQQLKAIKGQVDKSVEAQKKLLNKEQYGLFSEVLQGDMQNIGSQLTAGLNHLQEEIEEKILVSEGAAKKITATSKDEIKKHILANSEKTDVALKNLESFIRNELTPMHNILAGSVGKKEDDDLHEKIISSIQKLISAHDKIRVDVAELQDRSKQKIDVLNAQISELENQKAELSSALKEAIVSAENIRGRSNKETAALQAKIDELENEKADQKKYMSNELSIVKKLKDRIVVVNEKLTKNKIISENAIKEKLEAENQLAAIQELWKKQRVH